MTPPVHDFALRIDDPADFWQPVVTILVDGADLVAAVAPDSYVGGHPTQVLGPESPLLPARPARRVAVYRCSCGEYGCGCVAPAISREGDLVVWRDARDYTGVFVRATRHEPPPDTGKPVRLPDLFFEATQYAAEVARASATFAWTPADRREVTARLLAERLRADPRLVAHGLRLVRVRPVDDRDGTFEVLLRDAVGYVVTDVTAGEQPPGPWADALADELLGCPPGEWGVRRFDLNHAT